MHRAWFCSARYAALRQFDLPRDDAAAEERYTATNAAFRYAFRCPRLMPSRYEPPCAIRRHGFARYAAIDGFRAARRFAAAASQAVVCAG